MNVIQNDFEAETKESIRRRGAKKRSTFQKFNIAPENGWLESYLPFGMAYFQGTCNDKRKTRNMEI